MGALVVVALEGGAFDVDVGQEVVEPAGQPPGGVAGEVSDQPDVDAEPEQE
jgi:hypothetical protein